MKKLSLFLFFCTVALAGAQSVTVSTNYPQTQLTFTHDSNFNPLLNANGQQLWPLTNLAGLNLSVTNLPAGSDATVTNTGVINGIAWFQIGIPVGSAGAQGPPATNAIYPTAELTLTNINPLLCNGSNFIGYFPQLYDVTLNVPNTSVGISLGTNLVETVMASFDSTNWFAVTNSPAAIFTNVYVAVVGDNNTNYDSAITCYALDNWTYYGRTNWLIGQHLFANNPTTPLDVVNLQTMQTTIANATANAWQTVVDTNGVSHYQYAPNAQMNLDLTVDSITGAYCTGMKSVGTNWVLTSTNVPIGYQVQFSTNLSLNFGWQTLTPTTYTTSTNLYSATNVWTFTIPKTSVPSSYAFFRVVAFSTASATFTPPLTLKDVLILTPRTITNATDSTFSHGAGVLCADTNYVYISVATNLWKRAALTAW